MTAIGGNSSQPPPPYIDPNDPGQLLMSGELQSSEAQGLAALGYVDALDGLTPAEQQKLLDAAGTLMNDPKLPAGDQEALKKWTELLKNYPTTVAPSSGVDAQGNPVVAGSAFLEDAPPTNPYMSLGIMAMLYPILCLIQKVMADIVLQSSQLDQKMQQLTLSMAEDIFSYTVEAGQAKADQLRADMKAYFTQAATALLQAAFTIGIQVVSTKMEKTETDNLDAQRLARKGGPNEMGDEEYNKSKLDISSKYTQRRQFVGSLVQEFGTVATSVAQGVTAAQKATLTEEEALANALSQMLQQLISNVQQTQQKAAEEGKSASQTFQAWAQLYSDTGRTVTQAIYS